MSSDAERIEELTEIIRTVRERVRSRYPEPGNSGNGAAASGPAIRIPQTDLLPIVHARDAAQAKMAAIGSVNPRAGGILNSLIQFVKRTIARSLRWFVRDQVTFNRESMAAIEAVLEALTDHNRILLSLAAQSNERMGAMREELRTEMRTEFRVEVDALRAEDAALIERVEGLRADVARLSSENAGLRQEAAELKDMRKHWIEWRADWEHKLSVNEIQFLRAAADLQSAFQHRVTLMESNFRETVRSQHADYLGALDRSTIGIQKRLWEDMEKIRADYERLIYVELRLIRQRAQTSKSFVPIEEAPPTIASATPALNFDYGRFAERFRGTEDYVRRNQEFYKPFFEGRSNVLDMGCGRGEFLETMRDLGVPARGIDLARNRWNSAVRKASRRNGPICSITLPPSPTRSSTAS